MTEERGNSQRMDIESSSHAVPNFDEDFETPLLPIAVSSGGDSNERHHKDPIYMDRSWAIAFKINVVLTLISAAWFGTLGVKAVMVDSLTSAGRRRLHLGDSEEDGEELGGHLVWNILLAIVICVAVVCVVTSCVVHSLYHCGRGLIMASYVFFTGLWGVVTVITVILNPLIAFLPAMIFGILLLFIRKRRRIAFASANLKVACVALKAMPWAFRSTMLMGVVQFLWSAVAAIAALGSFVALESVTAPDGSSYRAIDCLALPTEETSAGTFSGTSCFCNGDKISDEECHFSGFGLPLMVIWLLSMSWGCAVIRNVVACTISGSVASWWFMPNDDAAPVKGAFHRSTHSSFGSLCKAAAVQNAINVITLIARGVLRFIPCAAGLLRWVDIAVKYVLAYTIAFIGIYGLDFNAARANVRELFKRRGVTTLANDVTAEVGFRFLAISGFIVYMLFSSVMMLQFFAYDRPLPLDSVEFWSIYGPQLFGLFTCAFLVTTVLELARSGYKAIFVCFVQDPEALAQKHDPEVHEHLSAAWTDLQNENTTVVGAPTYAPVAIN